MATEGSRRALAAFRPYWGRLAVAVRSTRPILTPQLRDVIEFGHVGRHQGCSSSARLPGNQHVVGADRPADGFELGSDRSRLTRVFLIEVESIDGTGEERVQAHGIRLGPAALADAVPQLEDRDRGGRRIVLVREGALQPLPNLFRPAVDQRDACVGVEEVCQSKTSRVGVRGWSRPSGRKGSGPKRSSWANQVGKSRIGSSKTPRPIRRTRTRSPCTRNSRGSRTAWLRPFLNTFAIPVFGVRASFSMI